METLNWGYEDTGYNARWAAYGYDIAAANARIAAFDADYVRAPSDAPARALLLDFWRREKQIAIAQGVPQDDPDLWRFETIVKHYD
jgi:hypothetical protein